MTKYLFLIDNEQLFNQSSYQIVQLEKNNTSLSMLWYSLLLSLSGFFENT